jgi:transglutaminase-like putative cysteine protease
MASPRRLPLPPLQRREARFARASLVQWLAMLPLAAALAALPPSQLFSGLAIGLGVLTGFKLLEARQLAEHRLVALLQLLSTGLVAAQRPELAASLLQLAATLLALAGLLALELGEGLDWLPLLRRSLVVLLSALPLALVLFVLVPRLGPFSALPLPGGSAAVVGLSDQLDPAGISELASSDEPAARVAFSGGPPPPPEQRYWRVLVHGTFDGRHWLRSFPDRAPGAALPPLPGGAAAPPAPAAAQAAEPAQLWLAAPSPQAAVPWSGRGRPSTRQLGLDSSGELRHRGPRDQRRVYSIAPESAAAAWQRIPPTPTDLSLPPGRNPRLEALGRTWSALPTPEQRLQAARAWFLSHNFLYSLRPGVLPDQAPFDAFLFERRIGFCGHYAASFSALMRAAGVPSRVVSGYRGGRWVVPIGGDGYLDLRQSDAHAWSEVWLPELGWTAVDPSHWIRGLAPGESLPSGDGLQHWLQRQWWGLDISWTRLWLGFDRDSQAELLRRLLGPALPGLGIVVLVALTLCLVLAVAALQGLQRRSAADAGRLELERLLRQLERLGLAPAPGETLQRFGLRLEQQRPELAGEMQAFVALYQQLRFAPRLAASDASLQRRLVRQRRRLAGRLQRSLR